MSPTSHKCPVLVDRATDLESVNNIQTDKEKAPTTESTVAAPTVAHVEFHNKGRRELQNQESLLLRDAGTCNNVLTCSGDYFKKPFRVTSFNPSLLKLLSQPLDFLPPAEFNRSSR